MSDVFVLLPVVFLFSVFVVLMFVTQNVEKREREKAKQAQLSSMKTTVNGIRDHIEKLKALHPTIESFSVIEGENTNLYADQGVIRDKSREYFFAIDTPATETKDKNGYSLFYVDRTTRIKVEGTVEDYIIRITSVFDAETVEVTYRSITSQFLGTHEIWKTHFSEK